MNQQNQISRLNSPAEPSTIEALDRALRSRDRQAVRAAVTQMLALFPRRADEDDAAVLVAGYVGILDDLPADAVVKAALKVCRGQAPGMDTRFAPSAAEFYRFASEVAGEWAERRTRLIEAPDRPQLRTRQEIAADEQARYEAMDRQFDRPGIITDLEAWRRTQKLKPMPSGGDDAA